MPDDTNPDRLLAQPSEFPIHQHNRTGSMSLGAAPNANGDEVSPINGDGAAEAPIPKEVNFRAKSVETVYNSEIGVQTLLQRLKQSIASAKVSF